MRIKKNNIKSLATHYSALKKNLDEANQSLHECKTIYEQEFTREMDELETERKEKEKQQSQPSRKKIKLDIKRKEAPPDPPEVEYMKKAKVDVKKSKPKSPPKPPEPSKPPKHPKPSEHEQHEQSRCAEHPPAKHSSSNSNSSSKLREIVENLYITLCKAFHPDRSGEDEKFRELQKKYETGDTTGIIFMGLETDNLNVEEDLGEDMVQNVQQELNGKIKVMERELGEIKNHIAWVWCQKRSRDKQLILRHRIIQKMRQDVLYKGSS